MNNSFKNETKLAKYWQSFFMVLSIASLSLVPEMALAADPIGNAMCKIFNLLRGSVAKTVGVIGIVALGIGLFLGKLNWGVAVAVGIGVVLIFGAPQVIEWISGDASAGECVISDGSDVIAP